MREAGAPWRRDIALYLAGGVLSAAIDVALMQTMLAAGAGVTLATAFGFGVSLLVNYAFHARYTFAGAAPGGAGAARFGRYLAVVALNYGLTLALVHGALALALAPLAGKLVALPLVAAVGFAAGKYWIFKKDIA
jgi:putative flippase GtrA